MADYANIPEFAAEQAAIDRRQKIAQALMQQGMMPLDISNRSAGKFIAPVSPLEGIAKILQAVVGARQVGQADDAAKALSDRYSAAQQDTVDRVSQALQGSPAISAPPEGGPGRPAVAPSIDAAVQAMLQSKMPNFQQAGMSMLADKAKREQAAAQQQQFLQALGIGAPPVQSGPQAAPMWLGPEPTGNFAGSPPDIAKEIQGSSMSNADKQGALRALYNQSGYVPGGTASAPATGGGAAMGATQGISPQAMQALVFSNDPNLQKAGVFLATQGDKLQAMQAQMADRQLARDQQEALRRDLAAQSIANQQAGREESMALRRELANQNEALQRQLADQRVTQMTPAQKQRILKDVATDFKNVGQTQQSSQEISNAISNILASPGLKERTGYQGYIPSWAQGKEAMTAQNRIDTLKGKITLMGKHMAAMSGSLGNMAVQEWKIVADSVNALDPRAGNFKEQLENVKAQAEGAAARIKDAYGRQYADQFSDMPQFAPENVPVYRSSAPVTPAAAPSTSGTLTPAEQSELDALRKRFGRQ